MLKEKPTFPDLRFLMLENSALQDKRLKTQAMFPGKKKTDHFNNDRLFL